MSPNRTLLGALIALALCLATRPVQAQEPSIEGTWRLVSRATPDGRTLAAPEVVGVMTFSNGWRHAVLHWRDEAGKTFSASFVRRYVLEGGEYRESNVLTSIEDGIGVLGEPGRRILDESEASGASPVIAREGRLEFRPPLHDEPVLSVGADDLVATLPDGTVDRWTRVRSE